VDAGVVETLFEEARAARAPEELQEGLRIGCARLSATGAFSDLDAEVEEAKSASGSRGVRLRVGAKPLRFSTQVGATVNARGETEAFTEVKLPNVTGSLDSLTLRIGEDQGDLVASVASVGRASGGDKKSVPLAGSRGSSLLSPRQSSPWVQLAYRRPTVAGTRWSLEVSARQAATAWEARQSLRLREREVEAAAIDPSGEHRIGIAVTERRPRLARAPPVAVAAAPSPLDGVAVETGGDFDADASPEVCMSSAASLKGALTYAFTRDWRSPRVGACHGGKVGIHAELAGLPGLSSVAHARAEATASLSASVGRFAPDTGYALPPTSSDAASPSKLRAMRRAALAGALAPHPGPAAALGLRRPSTRDPREGIEAVHAGGGARRTRRGEPSRTSLDPEAPPAGWRERVAGWLAPGLTVTMDASLGCLVPFRQPGSVVFRPEEARAAAGAVDPPSAAAMASVPSAVGGRSSVLDRFQIGSPRLRGFVSDGIGPRSAYVGPSGAGDSLGGDASLTASLRLAGPPPFPSVTLSNAGLRTHAWVGAGILLPGPLRSLGPVADRLVDWRRWSASTGLGLTLPLQGMGAIEFNYALAHWGPARDLRQSFSLSLSA